MIPTTWSELRRRDDGELLGYIAPAGDGFQANTVFGNPVGGLSDQDHAEQTLESIGLSYLAERWLLIIDGRDEPITVQIVEATPATVTVKSVDYGHEGDYGTTFSLDLPILPKHLWPERTLAG
jgi:hypothetical protein